jgi:hypothetical protein
MWLHILFIFLIPGATTAQLQVFAVILDHRGQGLTDHRFHVAKSLRQIRCRKIMAGVERCILFLSSLATCIMGSQNMK